MKKIAITGANGFIGSNLVNKLVKNDYEVAIICREKSNLESLNNVIDKVKIYRVDDDIDKIINSFREFNPECIIHLAAVFKTEHNSQDIYKFIDSNIKYPSIILEAMSKAGIRKFINTGTAWQHYNNDEYNPVCLYAATKESFEKIIEYYVKALNFKCITLKLFDSYGENDNRGKLISSLINTAISNGEINMSNGEPKMDLTHVDDISRGFIKAFEYLDCIDYGEHKKYALCTGKTLSLKEIVKIFEEQTGYKLKVNWGVRKYRDREIMEPWNKYEILPNWQSRISFEDWIKGALN